MAHTWRWLTWTWARVVLDARQGGFGCQYGREMQHSVQKVRYNFMSGVLELVVGFLDVADKSRVAPKLNRHSRPTHLRHQHLEAE